MKNCIYQFCYFVLLVLVLSCDSSSQHRKKESIKEHEPDQVATEYNNKALQLKAQTSGFNTSSDIKLLEESLILLDSAISIDPYYELAYSNKAEILLELEKPREAITVLSELSSINPEHVEAISGQGFIFEKLGKLDSADQYYEIAAKKYEKFLKVDPDNFAFRYNYAFILLFINKKNDALSEMEKIENRSSLNKEQTKLMRESLENFNREEFIKNF